MWYGKLNRDGSQKYWIWGAHRFHEKMMIIRNSWNQKHFISFGVIEKCYYKTGIISSQQIVKCIKWLDVADFLFHCQL